jgi:hypothetical protein
VALPAATAAAVLAALGLRRWRRKGALDAWECFLGVSALGVLALAAYDALYVEPFAMGHWYVPVSVTFVSLAVLPRKAWTTPSTARRLFLGAVCLGSLAVFALWHRRLDHHAGYARFFWEEAPQLRERYRGAPPSVLERDDGIVAFATGFPCLSGTGLSLDAEAAAANRGGRLLDLALSRGFDRIASLVYLAPVGYVGPAERVAASVEELKRARPGFLYEPEYVASDGFFVMLRVRPPAALPESR